ncbi:MAG: hypothetical protein HY721_32730 [Planctomycetes bacterium]|nr:hypothetical protein [Planctomycetota bacterium]
MSRRLQVLLVLPVLPVLGVLAVLAAAVLAACGRGPLRSREAPLAGDQGGRRPRPELRLNHIQAKGTHNSYHVAPAVALSAAWRYTHDPLAVQLESHGVRQIELDVHYRPGQPFAVFHVPGVDAGTNHGTLPECLRAVKGWSDAHRGHVPVFIFLEPKDEYDDHKIEGRYDELETEVLSVWPRERILAPDDVRRGSASLREAILERGWPGLDAVRGRAVLVLLDPGAHREAYGRGRPALEGRLFFVTSSPERADAAILSVNDPVAREAEIRDAVARGFIVRTRADAEGEEARANDRRKLEAALRSGAQLISTDYPALRADGGYWVEIPGGSPARPNPVTAPPGATAAEIEALDRP